MAVKIQESMYFGYVFCAIFDFKSRLDSTEILDSSTGHSDSDTDQESVCIFGFR